VPERRGYRSYKITRAAPGDDYAAQHEVLSRRFLRGKNASVGEAWQLPDLFVVDGGRGQLAAAQNAARDLGLDTLQLAGLAKERDTANGERLVDRIYLPGQKNPVPLKPNSPELFLLAHARDEAHRFANRSRERAGTKQRLRSELDPIVGIGPKTKARLLTHFGSLENLKSASDAEVQGIPGVNRGHLRALRAWIDGSAALTQEPASAISNAPDAGSD
jgi:excinuclease ABC subunit C